MRLPRNNHRSAGRTVARVRSRLAGRTDARARSSGLLFEEQKALDPDHGHNIAADGGGGRARTLHTYWRMGMDGPEGGTGMERDSTVASRVTTPCLL